jgi:hypothetical protein
MTTKRKKTAGLTKAFLLLLPLILLGGVIAVFVRTGGGLELAPPAPVEELTVERTVLEPGSIDIAVRNSGPEELTIAQVVINDAIWPTSISPGATIPRLGQATIHLDYGWVAGEAYSLTLLTSNAIAFDLEIPVAFTTPTPAGRTFLSFALIGLSSQCTWASSGFQS